MFDWFLQNINGPCMLKTQDTGQNQADVLNETTLFSIYNRAMMLSSRRFKWENLPEGVPDWWIEQCLFFYDKVATCDDKNNGNLILPCFNADTRNVYYMPLKYRLFGMGYSEEYDAEDVTVLYNNYLGIGMFSLLDPLLYNIYEATRTRDVNLFQQKMPRIFRGVKQKELTIKNIFNQVRRNLPAIFTEKSNNYIDIDTIDSTAPYIVDKLDTHIKDGWSDVLTVLGIQTHNIEKSERVQVAEVQAANEQTLMYKQAAIDCRERFCEETNKKFGLNLDVKWAIESLPILGGNVNGEVYYDSLRSDNTGEPKPI